MTFPEKVELAKACGAVFAALGAGIASVVGFINRKKISEIHVLINSRLDQLLLATLDKGRILERSEIASGAIAPPDTPAVRAAADLVITTAAATAEKLVSTAAEPSAKT